MIVAMGGANPLPVEVCTVRKRKCNSTLCAALNGQPFQLESGVFSGIEGLSKISQVVLRDCRPFLRPQPDK
jgi:hypothetical protein